jgi:high affinity Mn2+ porin
MIVNRLFILWLLAGARGDCQDNGPCAGTDGAAAQPAAGRAWSAHFQATSIGQEHGWFRSLYEGENSLPSHPEHRVSVTATIFLSVRLRSSWEFTVNPEIAGGRGFGEVTGIAGFPNGEIPRVASATPALYPARAYLRYSIPIGSGVQRIEDGANQVSGMVPASRWSIIAPNS